MSRLIRALVCGIFIHAVPSWGQGSVLIDGREWLQPVDFTGYTYDEINEVCPNGICSGTLPGSSIDLTGYTWASILDVSGLFNSYGLDTPFTEPFQFRAGTDSSKAMSQDFAITGDWCFGDCPYTFLLVMGMVRDPTPAGIPPYQPNAELGDECVGWSEVAGEDLCYFSNTTGISEPPGDGIGVWFFRQVDDPPPIPEKDFIVNLEEPIKWEIHSGVGSIRGWAISKEGIDRVEIYIDDEYAFVAPFGGERTDVADQYPEFPESDRSGFSLAFGYSNLEVGEHTVTARAFNTLGESLDSTSAFEVVAFDKDFIDRWDIVDLSRVFLNETQNSSEIELGDVVIDGKIYVLLLRWRAAEQGFEIIRIEQGGSL